MSEEEREETIQQNEDLIQKCEEDKKTAPDESTLKTVPKDSTYVDQEWQTLGGTEMVKGLTVSSEDSKRSLNVVSADDDSSITSFLDIPLQVDITIPGSRALLQDHAAMRKNSRSG